MSALAAVHVFAGKLRFLKMVPRSRWLSFAGGASVAYVMVHLLPEVARAQETVADDASGVLAEVEEHAYLVALAGLALFYGVELASRRSRGGHDGPAARDGAFVLSVASFAVYNAVIGYLVVGRAEDDLTALVLYTLALGLHFVINDFALRDRHKDAYRRIARWVLGAAVFVGWGIAQAADLADAAIGLLIAFIGGGVILNVMKEELPEERQSRLVPFLLGAAGYAALLQAV